MTDEVRVRNTLPGDFDGIIAMCRVVYSGSQPWTVEQLTSHLAVFPEGQFVAIGDDGVVAGMAAGLIIRWDDYEFGDTWRDFTDSGMFTNHDPVNGRTLYGAEVMVHPERQSHGIGSKLYGARRVLAQRLNLRRIRAAARLRGYHAFSREMTPQEYVRRVVAGELRDPTLSFQIHQGFEVIAVVGGYLRHDLESLGYAAVIEWRNPEFQG
jgi:GNAT superfamily N-acetyltransferase